MIDEKTPKSEYTAVALGNFDGVHIGHRQVLMSAKKYSFDKNIKAVALVFDIHPKNVFSRTTGLLVTNCDRKKEIEDIGILPIEISFKEVMNYSPEEFVEKVLVKQLNAKAVFCGYNYRFGKDGKADNNELESLCKKRGIELFVTDKVELSDGEAVSSSRLRKLLSEGKVKEANCLMQRNFSYALEVVHGQKRGREMGFPTINQYFPEELVIPKFGVYISTAEFDGKVYNSFTNIGSRPTFPEKDVRSETHIFDFDGDLYGKTVRVTLLDFLRPEKKFTSTDELIRQLNEDKDKCKM